MPQFTLNFIFTYSLHLFTSAVIDLVKLCRGVFVQVGGIFASSSDPWPGTLHPRTMLNSAYVTTLKVITMFLLLIDFNGALPSSMTVEIIPSKRLLR